MKIDVIATIIKREMLEIFIHKVMKYFFSANQIFLVAYCQLYITVLFAKMDQIALLYGAR